MVTSWDVLLDLCLELMQWLTWSAVWTMGNENERRLHAVLREIKRWKWAMYDVLLSQSFGRFEALVIKDSRLVTGTRTHEASG